MRGIRILVVLIACLSCALEATQDTSTMDMTSPRDQSIQPRSYVTPRPTNEKRRRRKKPRRPRVRVETTTVAMTMEDVLNALNQEDEYSQRVRSFASAIQDTDTFLRFLKLEEARHIRDYIIKSNFNFGNFTQSSTNSTANVTTPTTVVSQSPLPTTVETRPTDTVSKPSLLLTPPHYSKNSELPASSTTQMIEPTTLSTRYFEDEESNEVRIPNRGLLPPLEEFPADEPYVRTFDDSAQVNITESIERRAPLPLDRKKKKHRKPKSRNPDRYLRKDDDDYGELRLTVAESAYYKKRMLMKLPMIASYDSQQVIPGVAGRDYTVYSQPPESQFSCSRGHVGYVADVTAGCQAFYVCTGDGRGEPMLCPNGTLFNQDVLVCDWWFNVVCH